MSAGEKYDMTRTSPQRRRLLLMSILSIIALMIFAFFLAYFVLPPDQQSQVPQIMEQPPGAPTKDKEPVGNAY
ncbi:MAG TPA: hypothetical protein VIF60_22740 [Burkholderiaceae bacterium]|jgi:capsular polysaccharide biosynthesis protein